MSIKLMAFAWDMDIPSTEKMVLLCLCDYANDDGRSCYPSIATLAKRTSKNARTVQRALRWLENSNICSPQERVGTSTDYTINLDAYVTHDKMSPLTNTTQGGGVVSPGGGVVSPRGRRGVTQTINEPPMNHKEPSNNIRDLVEQPDGVDQEVWSDFLKHRKKKKADVSNTALSGIEREAEKAGWSLNDALAEIVTRGWTGFKSEWVKSKGKGKYEEEWRTPC